MKVYKIIIGAIAAILIFCLGIVEKSEYAVTSLKLNEMPKTN